ncbi:hypothetical protein Tco_1373852 [Tanacetum coccineum]
MASLDIPSEANDEDADIIFDYSSDENSYENPSRKNPDIKAAFSRKNPSIRAAFPRKNLGIRAAFPRKNPGIRVASTINKATSTIRRAVSAIIKVMNKQEKEAEIL